MQARTRFDSWDLNPDDDGLLTIRAWDVTERVDTLGRVRDRDRTFRVIARVTPRQAALLAGEIAETLAYMTTQEYIDGTAARERWLARHGAVEEADSDA